MESIILCAGIGTRMGAEYQDIPKALIELHGKSLLTRQIEQLKKASIVQPRLVLGHNQQLFTPFGLPSVHNDQYRDSNMVYSLYKAFEYFDIQDHLLVTYGDINYKLDVLTAYANSLEQSPTYDLYVAIDLNWLQLWKKRMDDVRSDAQSLTLDSETGLIIDIGKSIGESDLPIAQFMGSIAVHRHNLDRFKSFLVDGFKSGFNNYPNRSARNMFTTDLIQLLITEGWRVKPVLIYGGWIEVDTPSDLAIYENDSYFDWLRHEFS